MDAKQRIAYKIYNGCALVAFDAEMAVSRRFRSSLGLHPVPMQQLGYACTEHIKLDSKK